MTYSDEYLHHWGEVFTANNLYARFGITFEAFLQAPEALLDAAINGRARPLPEDLEHYPLLPAQVRVQKGLDLDDVIAELTDLLEDELNAKSVRGSNGARIEPLHHHRVKRRYKPGTFHPLRQGMPS